MVLFSQGFRDDCANSEEHEDKDCRFCTGKNTPYLCSDCSDKYRELIKERIGVHGYFDHSEVVLTDIEWNRKYNVVGKHATIEYRGRTLGTLVRTIDGQWMYYFKGDAGFN